MPALLGSDSPFGETHRLRCDAGAGRTWPSIHLLAHSAPEKRKVERERAQHREAQDAHELRPESLAGLTTSLSSHWKRATSLVLGSGLLRSWRLGLGSWGGALLAASRSGRRAPRRRLGPRGLGFRLGGSRGQSGPTAASTTKSAGVRPAVGRFLRLSTSSSWSPFLRLCPPCSPSCDIRRLACECRASHHQDLELA